MNNTLHIHVGSNIPGYLPESDLMCFENVSDALDALKRELKDQQEYYWESCELYGTGAGESCECEWCSVAADVEAALGAIADGDMAHVLKNECAAALRILEESGHAQPAGTGWIFSPPEGPDVHHWASLIHTDRDACEIAQEQDS